MNRRLFSILATLAGLFAGCASPQAPKYVRAVRPAMMQAGPVPAVTLVPVIDARRFGVSTALADNTAKLQAAVNAAGANGQPSAVWVPGDATHPLNFTGSTPVNLPSNFTLVGQGRGASILRGQAGRSAPLLKIDGKTNVTVRGLTIDKASGAAATGTAYGVYVCGNSSDILIEGVTCDAWFRPFQIAGGEGTTPGTCTRIAFTDCTATNSPQQFGFNFDDCDGVTLTRCHARTNGLDGFKARKKATRLTLRDCSGYGNGTFATGDTFDGYAGADGLTLDNLTADSDSGNGVTIKTGDLNIDSSPSGLNSAAFGYVRNIRINNLTSRNHANGYGLYLTLNDPATATEPLVNGCVIDGGYSEGDQFGLYINARNVSVNHPFIRKSLQHGIVVSSSAFDVEINDALIVAAGQTTNNTYHGISLAGCSNVRINRGLVVGKDGDQIHNDANLTALTAVTRYGCDIQPSCNAVWVNFLRARQIASNIVNNQSTTGTIIIDQLRGGDPEGAAFGVLGSLYRRDYSSVGDDGYLVWKVRTKGAPNSVGGTAGTVDNWTWLVQGAPVTNLPTASAVYNGLILRKLGGGGVADTLNICLKDAGGGFTWHQITAP